LKGATTTVVDDAIVDAIVSQLCVWIARVKEVVIVAVDASTENASWKLFRTLESFIAFIIYDNILDVDRVCSSVAVMGFSNVGDVLDYCIAAPTVCIGTIHFFLQDVLFKF